MRRMLWSVLLGALLFAYPLQGKWYPLQGKWYPKQPCRDIYEIDEPLWKTLSDRNG